MARQATVDTGPELAIRRRLHAQGLRYRVNYPLPVPGMARRRCDIAFPRCKVVVFVDGCFWHNCPEHGTWPKSNSEWWHRKLLRNAERDQQTVAALQEHGWTVIRIWEHEPPDEVADRIVRLIINTRRHDRR